MNSRLQPVAVRPAALGATAGFTLIELMVTLSVAAILVAAGVPAFSAFVQNTRLSGQASSLVYSLSFARSEAIKRGAQSGITVCPSIDGKTCGGTWSQGWIVWEPVAGQALQSIPALAGNNTLSDSAGAITFNPDGSASAAASFKFCDSRGATYARALDVNNLGRVQASQTPGKTVSGTSITTCP